MVGSGEKIESAGMSLGNHDDALDRLVESLRAFGGRRLIGLSCSRPDWFVDELKFVVQHGVVLLQISSTSSSILSDTRLIRRYIMVSDEERNARSMCTHSENF